MISEHEEEIKIEYYDNCSSDPLEENNIINVCTEKAFFSDCDNNINEFKEKSTELKLKSASNRAESKAINWYKEIDCNGRYLCRYCSSKYSTVQTLRHHTRRKHSQEAERLKMCVLISKRNHKFKCHVCQIRFQNVSDLESHFKSKHVPTDLSKSCFDCDATFSSVNGLTLHQLNVHNNVKKVSFVCTICGYCTSKRSHYNQHQNTHSAIKRHKCKYCDYDTNYLTNLKIHERIHTKNKPYMCDFENCVYTCTAKSALRSHRLKHFPNENMLYCDKCNYKTVYRQSLKKHQDSHDRNSIS